MEPNNNEEAQVEVTEELAQQIGRISDGMELLLKSSLKEWVVVELLHAIIGRGNINKGAIISVIQALPKLRRHCLDLKPEPHE